MEEFENAAPVTPELTAPAEPNPAMPAATDELVLAIAEHTQELQRRIDAMQGSLQELQGFAQTRADARALQQMSAFTGNYCDAVRREMEQLKQTTAAMLRAQAESRNVEFAVQGNHIVWRAWDGNWQDLVSLEKLRGPKGAPARGGGHTWRPNVDASGNLTWSESGDGLPPAEANIRGPQGEKGDKGDQGIQGERGIQGEQGIQGIQGVQGIQGEKGDTGEQGAQGIQGEQGLQGIQGIQGEPGLSNITTDTDTTIIGLLKGDGIKVLAAVAEVDYSSASHTHDYSSLSGKPTLGALAAKDSIATSDIASKTGIMTAVATGTKGANGNYAKWDANGDLVDGGAATACLPLSGGTLAGAFNIEYDAIRMGFNRPAGGVNPHQGFDFKNNGTRVGGIYCDIVNGTYWCGNGAVNQIWHSGNLTPANYLPLSGGLMTGPLGLPCVGSCTFSYGGGDGGGMDGDPNIVLSCWNTMGLYNPTSGGAYPYQKTGILDFRNGFINMKGGFSITRSGSNYTALEYYAVGENDWRLRIGMNPNGAGYRSCFDVTAGGSVTWGQHYITGNCSADSFTDRTPFYTGDALAELIAIKGDENGMLDHSTLPAFARKNIEMSHAMESAETEKDSLAKKSASKNEVEKKESIEYGRDIGAMVSILTKAIQQLVTRIEKLEENQKFV